jgi:hypothetical protein
MFLSKISKSFHFSKCKRGVICGLLSANQYLKDLWSLQITIFGSQIIFFYFSFGVHQDLSNRLTHFVRPSFAKGIGSRPRAQALGEGISQAFTYAKPLFLFEPKGLNITASDDASHLFVKGLF